MNSKTLNIKIPEELYDELKNEAKSKNISLASIVRLICSEYFNNKK
jgi:predicted HicB family RNase H-like nuclease